MLKQLRRSVYWLLAAVALFAAGCADIEWEVTVGADGQIEEWIYRFSSEHSLVSQMAAEGLETDRPAIEALSPYLQLSTREEGKTFVAEVIADMAAARADGIDLIAAVNEIPSLEDVFVIWAGSGVEPDGNIAVEYRLELGDAGDGIDVVAFGDFGYTIITHMPGRIVRFSHGEAVDARTHVSSVAAAEAAGSLNIRVESTAPASETGTGDPRVARIDAVIIREVPLDGRRTPVATGYEVTRSEGASAVQPIAEPAAILRELERRVTVRRVEGGVVMVRSDALRTVIRQQIEPRVIPPQLVVRPQFLPGTHLPFVTGRVYVASNWLAPGLFVQDFSFRQGLFGIEVVGEIVNQARRDYQQVVLGISFFDARGIFVDHYTVVIPNLPAGERRGFKQPLLGFRPSGVDALRWEWKYGI